MSSNVVPEVAGLRKTFKRLPDLVITQGKDSKNLSSSKENAFEIEMDVTPGEAAKTGFILYNEKGEKVNIYFDMKAGRLVMDRTESGKTKFGEKAEAHKIEKEFDLHEHREIKEPMCRVQNHSYS